MTMRRIPAVGIITPVYNRVSTLADACQSVRAQDYPHVHVLVDDGSTDGFSELAERLRHNDRDVIVLRRDRSPRDPFTSSNAMNVGLRYLANETDVALVTRLDSDDLLARHSLRVRAERFDEHVGAVFARQGGFTHDNFWNTADRLHHDENLTKSNIFRYMLPYHSLMFRRDLLEGLEYPTDVSSQEDVDFTLRVFQKTTDRGWVFAFVDALTVWIRAHEDSISAHLNAFIDAWMISQVWRRHRDQLRLMDLLVQLRINSLKYRLWHPALGKWQRIVEGSTPPPADPYSIPAEVEWFAGMTEPRST